MEQPFPVICGIPFPEGALRRSAALRDPDGTPVRCRENLSPIGPMEREWVRLMPGPVPQRTGLDPLLGSRVQPVLPERSVRVRETSRGPVNTGGWNW